MTRSLEEVLAKHLDFGDEDEAPEVKEPEAEPEKAPEPEKEPEAEPEPENEPEKAPEKEPEAKEPEAKEPEKAEEGDAKDPPPRFAAVAKADWNATPETVRREVRRLEAELTAGIDHYREQIAELRPYHQMAQQAGRKLPEVLASYVGMEALLRSDPARGLAALCSSVGLAPADAAALLSGQQPAAPRPAQPLPAQPPVAALARKVEALERERILERNLAKVEAFAASKPDFDALADDIAHMLETGYAPDLPTAYETAKRLRSPAPAPAPSVPAAPKLEPAKPLGRGTGDEHRDRPRKATTAEDAVANSFARFGL